jgi:hypothetical protein
MDISLVLSYLNRDNQFNYTVRDTYESLVWVGDNKPTLEYLNSIYDDALAWQENNNKDASRADAYKNESDPIFFKWQRGEATEQQWLDKVNEIKSRY